MEANEYVDEFAEWSSEGYAEEIGEAGEPVVDYLYGDKEQASEENWERKTKKRNEEFNEFSEELDNRKKLEANNKLLYGNEEKSGAVELLSDCFDLIAEECKNMSAKEKIAFKERATGQ